jgi:hypothetical protein
MSFGSKANRRTLNVPRTFCSRCRRDRSHEDRMCSECGETLAAQGFCEICDQFWIMPVGSVCPKHDSRLESGPAKVESPFAPGESPRWTTVGVYDHALHAGGPRLRLEAEGIPTFLDGERMGDHHAVASGGGVRLQVPGRWAEHAHGLLNSPRPVADADDWDDDVDQPQEPREWLLGRTLGWGVLAFLAALISVIIARMLGA